MTHETINDAFAAQLNEVPVKDNTELDNAIADVLHIHIEYMAKAAHAINRAYCQAIGDDSQLAWADAPAWQKDSAINGVKFRLANPDATPEQMHDSWMKQKIAEGWVWGPVKDVDAKTHPCMRPYNELPQEQRVKDYLFGAVVEALR